MKVLGVDPGETTGGFGVDTTTTELLPLQLGCNDFCDWFVDGLAYFDLVVSERFVISERTVRSSRGDENWSIEQIGWMRHHCRRRGIEFRLEGASDSMKFAPNDRLKHVGWYTRGKGHTNDAARVTLLTIAKRDQPYFRHIMQLP